MSSLVLRDPDRELRQLAVLSHCATRVLELGGAGEDDPDTYAGVIRLDPGLAASIVQMVNSPALGLGHPVHSIREACFSLDARKLLGIVGACAVMRRFPRDGVGSRGFDRHAFWIHCAATATLAGAVAREVDAEPELAFVTGLLHDLGRITLESHFPRQFRAILLYRERHDVWIRDAEAAVLGFDHTVVGERLAGHWQLPRDIADGIAHHHQPERSTSRHPVAAIVHVADILARGLEVGNPGDDTIPLLSEEALRVLGLNWTRLRRCLHRGGDGLSGIDALVDRVLPRYETSAPDRAETH